MLLGGKASTAAKKIQTKEISRRKYDAWPSEQNYSLKERGKRKFSIDEALIVAKILGYSVKDLFSADELCDDTASA